MKKKRFLCFALALAIMIISMPMLNLTQTDAASSFVPRTVVPDSSNPYYKRKANGGYNPAIEGNPNNPLHVSGSVLPNCVGYVVGRFNEEAGYGECKYAYAGNAENFWGYYNGKLETGQTPKVGAIMCWRNSDSSKRGHVCIVEEVISDTKVKTSESGYNANESRYWFSNTRTSSNNWGGGSTLIFQGFIYNPDLNPNPFQDEIDLFNASQNTSIAGYYYLTTNYASISSAPVAAADKVRSISHGEVLYISASGTNSYGNEWYKTTDGYIYPKTDTGVVRLTRVPSPFYFEKVNVSSVASSLSDRDYVCSLVHVNGSYSFSDTTSLGCIIYEKSGSSYTEVARATDNHSVNGKMYYNISQSPTSSNTKFYATGTSNIFSFTPNHTYYYRMFVTYGSNSTAYSYNYPDDSAYYSFVAPAATSVTAVYSNVQAVNVTAVSAALSYRCDVSGTSTTNVSSIKIYLYSSNLQSLGVVYSQTPSFGGYGYFGAGTDSPDVLTYAFQPETTYKARICSTILGIDYYSDYVTFTTLSCNHIFGEWVLNPEPTCDEIGHYRRTCSICGFVEETEVEALGHNYGAPTWTWTGVTSATAKFVCANDPSHIQNVNATITSATTTAATCTTAGVKTYTATVTFEGQTYTNTKTGTIPAIGHNYGAPTWTWTGFTAATAKFVCANDPSHIQNVNATITSTVTTAATCTTAGVKTYTATITFNGQTYTNTKTETIPAPGHNYSTPTWTWTGFTAATAKFVCANDSNHVQNVNATITSNVTTAATCTTAGVKTYTATVTFNGQTYTNTKTETIPAVGHDYGTPTYTWASDYGSVTATRICANDPSHIETETVSTTSQVTKQPTYEANGETTYTATFSNSAFATQTKVVANIPKLEQEVDEDTPQIDIESKKVRNTGNREFTVELTVKNNPGFNTGSFKVEYDSAVMTLKSATIGDSFNTFVCSFANLPYLTFYGSNDISADGVLFTLCFELNETAPVGDYYISLSYEAGDIANFNEEDVDLAVVPGKITVIEYMPGDINGDGTVNVKDLTRLLKYINHENVEVVEAALDVNGDGNVNVKDLTRLLKYINHEDVQIF